jgi:hypothetical protein
MIAMFAMFFAGAMVFTATRYGMMTLAKRHAPPPRPAPLARRRAEPAEITALRDQVMGPISDAVAEGERKAQEQWDREHAPKPSGTEPDMAGDFAALARENEELRARLAGLAAARTVNETRVDTPPPPDVIAADDVHVLRIERAQLEAELERMAWDREVPRSNRRFHLLMRQLNAIDAQIDQAVKAGKLRAG